MNMHKQINNGIVIGGVISIMLMIISTIITVIIGAIIVDNSDMFVGCVIVSSTIIPIILCSCISFLTMYDYERINEES